ncbi:GatB/YqeY domain-containing protein [candidate division KSB1 bacterium]|nr:GatB/YqeY domain-containing protein [candidate division KSB1 bacterium]TDI89267.1 MAG: GatB/YqeY domain-containing protein [Caldithrix sp.]
MEIQDRLSEDLKTAMKAKEKVKVETIRMVRAQLKNFQIAKRDELTEEDEISVVINAAKIRKEALELYEKSDRQDLIDRERQELEIISAYLPAQLSKEEVDRVVLKVMQEVGASSPQDMGKVMGAAMKELRGKADGKMVQEIVREKLN